MLLQLLGPEAIQGLASLKDADAYIPTAVFIAELILS